MPTADELFQVANGLAVVGATIALSTYTRTVVSRYLDFIGKTKRALEQAEAGAGTLQEKPEDLREKLAEYSGDLLLIKAGDTVLVVLGILVIVRFFFGAAFASESTWPDTCLPFSFTRAWCGLFGATVIYLALLHWDWWRRLLRLVLRAVGA